LVAGNANNRRSQRIYDFMNRRSMGIGPINSLMRIDMGARAGGPM
jgi:hypothetical protein